jgi:ribosomal protein L37E
MNHPRFFCENCGAEVHRNTQTCPRCGRYFASVRCPACGFTGEEGLFKGGCPVCGYSASREKAPSWPEKKKPEKTAVGALPWWVYFLTIIALICVVVVLYSAIK